LPEPLGHGGRADLESGAHVFGDLARLLDRAATSHEQLLHLACVEGRQGDDAVEAREERGRDPLLA